MTRKIILCVLIAASVLWTAFIFSNSIATAEKSSAQSLGVTETVNKVASAVGVDQEITESTVREMAHFTEFAVLAVLLSSTVAAALCYKKALGISLLYICASVPTCFLLAGVDELIQKFSDGRACQFTDMLLDTLGAVCGCALFIACYTATIYILEKIKKHKQSANINGR